MSFDYPCKFDHKKLDHDSNDYANRHWHRVIKAKSEASDAVKAAVKDLISSEMIPVAIATRTIECFFKKVSIHPFNFCFDNEWNIKIKCWRIIRFKLLFR